MPVLLTVISCCCTTIYLLNPSDASTATEFLGSAPFASIWTSNLYFAWSDVDYFSTSNTQDLFLHTWSLGVEEQFYIVWPFIIILSSLIAANSNSNSKSVYITIGVVGVTSFIAQLLYINSSPLHSFYQMPFRAWEFAAGGLLHVLIRPTKRPPHKANYLYIALAITGIATTVFFYDDQLKYPGLAATVPVLCACVFISASYRLEGSMINLPSSLIWVGDRSYSIYLWHWPLINLTEFIFGESTALHKVLIVLVTLALSNVTYQYIELPFWKGAHKETKNSTKAIILCSLSLALLTHSAKNTQTISGSSGNSADWRQAVLATPSTGGLLDSPIIYQMGCDTWTQTAAVTQCQFGDDNAERTIVLFGDSIGAQWFSLIASTTLDRPWKLIVITKSACPMVDKSFYYERIKSEFTKCDQWRTAAIQTIVDINPDLIFVGSSYNYPFTTQDWYNGSKSVWLKLLTTGARLVVLAPTSESILKVPRCVSNKNTLPDTTARCANVTTNPMSNAMVPIERLAKELNVEILDFSQEICASAPCENRTTAGVRIFKDHAHLTDSFTRSLIPTHKPKLQLLLEGS